MSMTQADFNALAKLQHLGSPLGRTFYVDSAHTKASANAAGTPDVPFNSIANALARLATTTNTAVASSSNATGVVGTLRGDVILVAPSHTETISAAATTWSRSGVRIIGLGSGNGQDRPIITFTTTTAAQLIISGSKVSVENIHFTCNNLDTLVQAISVTGTDVSFRNCNANLGTTNALGCQRFIDFAAGSSRCLVEDCTFTAASAWDTMASAVLISGTPSIAIIRRNIFIGPFGSAIGAIENTAAANRVSVLDNVIHNQTSGSTKAMIFHASTTGMIAGNRMQILSGTAPITGAAMSVGGPNYYSNAIGIGASPNAVLL